MAEKLGIETLKNIVSAVAEVVAVGYGVLVEKKGIWHLIALQNPISTLSKIDFKKVKEEIADLSESERESLQSQFKAALPQALSLKVAPGVDLLEKAIDLVEDAISFVTKAIEDGKKIYFDAKAYLAL